MGDKNIRIVVGGESFGQQENDRSLLQSALRAGIGFPYECSSGGCGTCRFKLISGEVETMWPDAPGLSERDRRKNFHLACQCRAINDIVIQITTEDRYRPAFPPALNDVELVGVRDLTKDMREFNFKSNDAAEFIPGQYALIEHPAGARRCYSMSNLPNREGIWQFIVKRTPNGNLSQILFELKVGAKLYINGPYGLAHVQNSERDVLCVAGGSGLAPMISIARSIACDPMQNSKKIFVFYGGRTCSDICGRDYLENLPGWGDRLFYCPVVSDIAHVESVGWNGAKGFVHEELFRQFGDLIKNYEIYIAGPPPMVNSMQSMLMADIKVPFSQIHFDRFY